MANLELYTPVVVGATPKHKAKFCTSPPENKKTLISHEPRECVKRLEVH